jgi:hypothetical protein
VAALGLRLTALEERLQEGPAKESPSRRQTNPGTSRKIVAWLATGSFLAMLAGGSVVYGQSAVDSFFISKEGDVSIGPSGGLFVGKAGNVGIGTDTPSPDNKLEVKGKIAAQSLNAAVDARAGDLRVGAELGAPGIYSEKGDVVVGSESKNVWLYGKVAISTEADAQKRNQPEALYVDGGLKTTGAVDGNMKVVFQRDDDPSTTYQKPLWRYHMT